MKISDAIAKLQEIRARYGDVPIVGGFLLDETRPTRFSVVNADGAEVWPQNPNDADPKANIEGVFIE